MITCERCGGNCDNGEVTGGICLECIEDERQKMIQTAAMAKMINSQPYQLEFKLKGGTCARD